MFLLHEMASNAADVSKDFGMFVENVLRKGPQFVARNRDVVMTIATDHLKALVESSRLTVGYEIDPESGTYVGTLYPFILVDESSTLDGLKEKLAQQAIEYTSHFFEDLDLYMKAPKMRSYLPYVLNIALQEKPEAILTLIDAHVERP